MRNIETEIEALKAQIAMLEKEKQGGFCVKNDYYENYFIAPNHDVLYNLDEEVIAIIVDEEAVRRYLADKDAV